MADFTTLANLLHLDSPDEFQKVITALIESSVQAQLKTIKKEIESKLHSSITTQKRESDSLNTQLSSVLFTLKSLQDDFSTFESARQFESKQLGRQKSIISDAEEKIDRFSRDVEYLQSSLVNLHSDLSMKANITDVNRVNSMLSVMCPMMYFEKLDATVATKADDRDLKDIKSDLEKLTNKLSSEYMPSGEMENSVRKIQEKNDKDVKNCVSVQHFTRITQEIEKSIAVLQWQLRELTNSTKQESTVLMVSIKDVKDEVSTKASNLSLLDLRNKVEKCASARLLEESNEAVERWYAVVEDVRGDVEKVAAGYEEVLIRFDEILLDKANKTDVSELESRCAKGKDADEMKRQMVDIQGDITTLMSLSSKSTQLHDDLSQKFQDLKSIVSLLKSEKRDYLSLIASTKLLQEQLDLKATKSDLAVICDSKSTKLEVQSLIRSLGVMHRIEKLVIMLLHHSIKCISEMTAEVAPTNFPAAEWLLKHAEMVSAWASLYEPIENEIEFPPDILNLLAAKSSKALATTRGSLTPLGLTPRNKTSGLSTSPAFGSGQITKKLLSRRYESATRKNAMHLPSLESGFDYS